jgi:MFS family permease
LKDALRRHNKCYNRCHLPLAARASWGFLTRQSVDEAALETRAEQYPHLSRNFTLGVVNGGLFVFAEALMSIDTVLTWFVQQLGGSNFLIGLVGPLRDAGWFLPQLFVSHRLQREPLKMPLYRRAAVVRSVAWFVWTIAAFVLVGNFPALLLIFFLAYGVNALASGFAGLPFMDIVAKTIPPTRRGSYFGGRLFAGGVLALIASVVVGLLLSEQNPQPFPINVGTIFVLSWLAAVGGLTAFALVKEPPGDVRDDGYTFAAHLQRAMRLPRHNPDLRYLLIARVVILLSYVAAPFYSIYSINVLGAPAAIIGVYLGVRTIVSLAINPVWSRLSDRRGNKIVMQLATAIGVVMLVWVVVVPGAARSLNMSPSLIAYAVVPVFALMGAYETGLGIGAVNLTLEVAPANDRAIYIGLTNTILGVAYLSTAVSGLIVDLVGYEGVFVLGLILLLVAFWALWRLRDPRELLGERKTHVG